MRGAFFASVIVAVSGCVALAPAPALPAGAPDAPGSEIALAAIADRSTLALEGSVELAGADGGAQLHRCANAPGVFGVTLTGLTPGAPFALLATGDATLAQDLDILFYRAAPTCLAASDAMPQHVSVHGDEVGFVPPEARAAVVWLYEGAHAGFRYSEFPPLAPATTTLQLTDAMGFRDLRPAGIVSTYHDLYEPHIAVAGTGTIYVTGHTMSSNSHHAPVYASRDDGASWEILPDPQPLPRDTTRVPAIGGRVGQGNEGGLAVDDAGHAWLYDAAYMGGLTPVYSWCDDGRRSCGFEPDVFDRAALAAPCPEWPAPRFLDKPWARFGGGKLLLSNVALPGPGVDEFRAASAVGLYDPATGEAEWNACIGAGGMPGVPANRAADGHIAMPQVQRGPTGEGWMRVHHGDALDAMRTSPPIVPAHKSWQICNTFNGYGDFGGTGDYFLATATGGSQIAVSATRDFEAFDTLTFDVDGLVRYLWLAGDPSGEGALVTWGVARDCDLYTPVTFYAAHVALAEDGIAIGDVTRVASNLGGTCGHYMGSDVGPDGRAYLVVHTSTGACGGAVPQNVPFTHTPWRIYVQDAGPTGLS